MKIIISPYSHKMINALPNPKNYPFVYWHELITLLQDAGHEILQIGVPGEDPLVDNLFIGRPLKELKEKIKEYDLFISVDNFFPHMAAHYGMQGIVLFSRSDPKIFGYPRNVNLLKDRKYLRPDQFGQWHYCQRIADAFVEPHLVFKTVKNIEQAALAIS